MCAFMHVCVCVCVCVYVCVCVCVCACMHACVLREREIIFCRYKLSSVQCELFVGFNDVICVSIFSVTVSLLMCNVLMCMWVIL